MPTPLSEYIPLQAALRRQPASDGNLGMKGIQQPHLEGKQ
jgi:hypothetical protein